MAVNNQYALSVEHLSEQIAALDQAPPERTLDRAVQLANVAVAWADKAESAGDHRQAAQFYGLAAQAYRHGARALPPDLRESMLSPGRYWDERAALALKRAEEATPMPATTQPAHRQESAIHTPKPMSISALAASMGAETKTQVVRGGAGRRQKPPAAHKRRGERFERPTKGSREEPDRTTPDRTIRKPGQK